MSAELSFIMSFTDKPNTPTHLVHSGYVFCEEKSSRGDWIWSLKSNEFSVEDLNEQIELAYRTFLQVFHGMQIDSKSLWITIFSETQFAGLALTPKVLGLLAGMDAALYVSAYVNDDSKN